MPADAIHAEKNINSRRLLKIDKNNSNTKKSKRKNVTEKTYNSDDLIFALDIGTRSIVAIVGIPEKGKLKVIAAEVLEHKERAMLDGQIHDISIVAEAIKVLKEKIEKKLGFTLNKVAIAAAGRALRTSTVKIDRVIEQGKEISQDIISSLEMEGIQQAQYNLDSDFSNDEKTQFYCVGYSVIHYYLDGYTMSSLQGHKGNRISVEILATFLPHIVVDSLYTVMNRVGLEVISLTLEPIAALNVTIPEGLRLLNLALVDIGAGTSDIALTKDGSVVGYAMVPIAGDEITEIISQHYLVDFNTAEKMKILMSTQNESITFKDILGKKLTVEPADILEVIKPSAQHLAEIISQKILDYNKKSPSAVFLIGGGSQIPGLTKYVADYLQIPEDRVVVRGREIIQSIKFSGKKLSGPEAITPFGIAITAQLQKGQDFLTVTINGRKIRLFNSRKLTVADALVLIGFNPRQLIGSTGKGVTFMLNGEKKIIRGEYGKAAEIFINEKPANLETVLNIGDNITVNPAEDGKNAEVRVGNFIKRTNPIKIYYKSNVINAGTYVLVNGKEADTDKKINNGDSVEISEINTFQDLLKVCEINADDFNVLINGQQVSNDYILKNMDVIECNLREAQLEQHKEIAEIDNLSLDTTSDTDLDVNSDSSSDNALQTNTLIDSMNNIANLSFEPTITINDKTVVLKNDKKQHIFVDAFNYIDFDISKPQGSIALRLNGKTAGFTDIIKPGDVIDIYWEK